MIVLVIVVAWLIIGAVVAVVFGKSAKRRGL